MQRRCYEAYFTLIEALDLVKSTFETLNSIEGRAAGMTRHLCRQGAHGLIAVPQHSTAAVTPGQHLQRRKKEGEGR